MVGAAVDGLAGGDTGWFPLTSERTFHELVEAGSVDRDSLGFAVYAELVQRLSLRLEQEEQHEAASRAFWLGFSRIAAAVSLGALVTPATAPAAVVVRAGSWPGCCCRWDCGMGVGSEPRSRIGQGERRDDLAAGRTREDHAQITAVQERQALDPDRLMASVLVQRPIRSHPDDATVVDLVTLQRTPRGEDDDGDDREHDKRSEQTRLPEGHRLTRWAGAWLGSQVRA
jgi:hypothetical protein